MVDPLELYHLVSGNQVCQSSVSKFKFPLAIRKTVDGRIMITDHPDIDIVVLPEQNKIIAFIPALAAGPSGSEIPSIFNPISEPP